MNFLKKLWTGGGNRKTRLHDELGNAITISRLLRNAPRGVLSGLGRVLFDQREERPWISYDAQALLARLLNKDSRVLEWGSGMSTMWYARHAAAVTSIENFRPWYDLVSARIKALGNVDYRFAADQHEYTALAPEGLFDLIMIDGNHRDDCAELAIQRLAQGGVIYLDNSDQGIDERTGDVPRARQILLDFAQREGLPVHEFTDFAPTQFHVQQGLWIGPVPA